MRCTASQSVISTENLLSTKATSETPSITHPTKEHIPDWKAYDEDIFPILEQLAGDIYTGKNSSDGRPGRLSERLIYQQLNLSAHRLEKMPKCQVVLARYSESYEENWARRIIWVYHKLKTERLNEPIFWSDIRALSGVKNHLRSPSFLLSLPISKKERRRIHPFPSFVPPHFF